MIKLDDILAGVYIIKTRTGFKVHIEQHEDNTAVEDLSFLMIIEKAVNLRQKEMNTKDNYE